MVAGKQEFQRSLPPFFLKEESILEILEHRLFLQTADYKHHDTISCHSHSLKVAKIAFDITAKISVDRVSLIRGALLHDFYLYDWHEGCPPFHGFRHPEVALRNASGHFSINRVEKDIILRHMFPLTPVPPVTAEAVIVCIADKAAAMKEYSSIWQGKLWQTLSHLRNRCLR